MSQETRSSVDFKRCELRERERERERAAQGRIIAAKTEALK